MSNHIENELDGILDEDMLDDLISKAYTKQEAINKLNTMNLGADYLSLFFLEVPVRLDSNPDEVEMFYISMTDLEYLKAQTAKICEKEPVVTFNI